MVSIFHSLPLPEPLPLPIFSATTDVPPRLSKRKLSMSFDDLFSDYAHLVLPSPFSECSPIPMPVAQRDPVPILLDDEDYDRADRETADLLDELAEIFDDFDLPPEEESAPGGGDDDPVHARMDFSVEKPKPTFGFGPALSTTGYPPRPITKPGKTRKDGDVYIKFNTAATLYGMLTGAEKTLAKAVAAGRTAVIPRLTVERDVRQRMVDEYAVALAELLTQWQEHFKMDRPPTLYEAGRDIAHLSHYFCRRYTVATESFTKP